MSKELHMFNAAKEALLEGLDSRKKVMTSMLMDNAFRVQSSYQAKAAASLMESAPAGSTAAGNIATSIKTLMPLIRRVAPEVIANEILGVQPMSGPTMQVNTRRVRYAQTIPADGTGVIAGDEALSPFQILPGYGGNASVTNPAGANTASLEGTGGNKLSLEIVKETVTAKSRKLQAEWTYEAEQDSQSQYGVDLEAETMEYIAQEMVSEQDQEFLFKLRQLAGPAAQVYNPSQVTGTPTSIVDAHAALAVLINNESNQIALNTRRGQANWIVVSGTALTILQSAKASGFVKSTEGTFGAPDNSKFVGTLNSQYKVYVDSLAGATEDVLVGLKKSEAEAAAFYCPYVPLMAIGPVIDPTTFTNKVSFMTRYGYLELSDQGSSFGNAQDYVRRIGIEDPKFL